MYVRVNDTDYGGQIVVEIMDYYPDGPAVPPWEEWGLPDLAGPFATWAEAYTAATSDYMKWEGIHYYHEHRRDAPPYDQ